MGGVDPARDPKVWRWVATVITAAWSISFIVDIIVPEYDPPSSVGSLMLLVAGAIFGEPIVRKLRSNGQSQ